MPDPLVPGQPEEFGQGPWWTPPPPDPLLDQEDDPTFPCGAPGLLVGPRDQVVWAWWHCRTYTCRECGSIKREEDAIWYGRVTAGMRRLAVVGGVGPEEWRRLYQQVRRRRGAGGREYFRWIWADGTWLAALSTSWPEALVEVEPGRLMGLFGPTVSEPDDTIPQLKPFTTKTVLYRRIASSRNWAREPKGGGGFTRLPFTPEVREVVRAAQVLGFPAREAVSTAAWLQVVVDTEGSAAAYLDELADIYENRNKE